MLTIGLDVGGTGARAALARDGDIIATTSTDRPTRIGSGGVDAGNAIAVLTPLVRGLITDGAGPVGAIAAGLTGFALLGDDLRVRLPQALAEATGAATVVLCSDMLTSYAGALGLRGGAVVAAGTGAVALGSDWQGAWQRVDGWGYLLGDAGGGSWLGRAGMQAALRAADGRPGGSDRLLAALIEQYGDPVALVRDLAGRDDRAGVMAGFVPAIAAAAAAGDPVAGDLLADAGTQLATSALAALPPGAPPEIAYTGNLFQAGPALWGAFHDLVSAGATLLKPAGTAVDGALRLAQGAAAGSLPPNAPLHLTRTR
ncbi:MAG: ATPase [Hamadaea sp.]|uniref:N-acetylglucosamine kinase n=1 Tax=Hamadaea sp. TaxID=2024425 RepID=UPI00178F5DA4|nr:BadF/BadG/BcrA/BcrD ATPase family protein [Hamadaea sp.]NUR73992.1 ATPase [Hamadaea sp.]NUT21209.1 ATPase [Hamadaea sp.]